MFLQLAVTLIVMVLLLDVNPEFASKNTLSVAPGITLGREFPPDVVLQWLMSFQFPLPPTQ